MLHATNAFIALSTLLNFYLTEFWGYNFYEIILDHCTYNFQYHLQKIYHAYYLILGHRSLQKITVRICLTSTNSGLKVELCSLHFTVRGKNHLRRMSLRCLLCIFFSVKYQTLLKT